MFVVWVITIIADILKDARQGSPLARLLYACARALLLYILYMILLVIPRSYYV